MLIRGLMKRRFWWTIVDKPTEDVQFAWSQLKNIEYISYEKPSNSLQKHLRSLSSKSLNTEIFTQTEEITSGGHKRKSSSKRSNKSTTDADI